MPVAKDNEKKKADKPEGNDQKLKENFEKAAEFLDPETVRSLEEEDKRGKEDAERIKSETKKQKGATDELIEHDLTAENGPHGAQPHTPKPPYWGQSVEEAQAEWPKDASEMTEEEKKGSPKDSKREAPKDKS